MSSRTRPEQSVPARDERIARAQLTVLATSDLHVDILGYDYYSDQPNRQFGLARIAPMVEALRAETPNTLLLDNGDYLQGNPLGDYMALAGGLAEAGVHPILQVMNAMGYDAATLGNHEFDFGVDYLDRVNREAAFPIVSANVAHRLAADPLQDTLHGSPYALLEREIVDEHGQAHPLTVGVIGVLPPQVLVWNGRHLGQGFAARDMLEALAAWVPEMRRAGAEVVIALAHTGIDPREAVPGMENAAFHIAGLPGIDAVVAGHQHQVFPGSDFPAAPGVDPIAGTLQGTPTVMPGFWGSHLGVITLELERMDGRWRAVTGSAAARPAEAAAEKPAVAAIDAAHAGTLDYVRQPVGAIAAPLHSYFALVGYDPCVQVINQAQAHYVRAMLQGTEWDALPLLSAAAPFKAGGRAGPGNYIDIPAGELAIRNIADLYPHANQVRAIVVDGGTVREWVERAAGIFARLVPGVADQPLIDPTVPSYNFDVLSGLCYRIDPSAAPRYDRHGRLINPDSRRIVELSHDGRPVTDDQTFVVATNSYRASGGGTFPGLGHAETLSLDPDLSRDILLQHLIEVGAHASAFEPVWSFASLSGIEAVFLSGPAGRSHLADVRRLLDLDIVETGRTVQGFAEYRVTR
ncbi:MAG: bifunctional 2',3'-cyclic-nucleotide 2'-phosphodiesterase/3'-nucleotidase [Pseudomonadota bacterium]